MWLDFIHGKEKVKFMFNDELSLDDSEFENFLFYDLSKIRICFNTKHIPKKIPDKWKKKEFNGLSITLILVGVNRLDLQGNRVGFICSPIIEMINNEVRISISNGDGFNLSCFAELIVIDSIEPYLDQRWK
ncbi:Imm50 family immunity protein [Erwinia sp.]|uniref:Imm50 family immunity protein n=1 Tax=Erwinia citreus TaxID=558 RepID=UPI002899E712|nr:Imm50 family immunity protein [Erwinia sp.]